MSRDESSWWKHGVFYQIYPRSFMDGNGDGIGDLMGINNRLDYLAELGIDAVWISPFYPSPMADFGYDIADFTGIDPMFGNLDTFKNLLEEAHQRNIRIILDYIPNHSSDQHAWFIESRASRENPKRDWYIWRDPDPRGGPPNNWESLFGGSAWEWDENTAQYYLHLFVKEQPDLNWRNPEVVGAMHDVLRFWLDLGVDGFRVDAVMVCAKHPEFPDNPPAKPGSWFAEGIGLSQEPRYFWDLPEVHDIVRGFRKVIDRYPGDRLLIGETAIQEPLNLVKYYGENQDEFHIPFNFINLFTTWNASVKRRTITSYYEALPAWAAPNFVFGNHDFSRLATRYGASNLRAAGLLLLTLRGIPTIYYGDEIGMENVHIPPDKIQDPWGINKPDTDLGRDPSRTPMQWDSSPNAGFSPEGVEPWLPVAKNYRENNVRDQKRDPNSTLNFYKRLLKLRRDLPALHRGDLTFVDDLPEEILGYTRQARGEMILIAINFGEQSHHLDLGWMGTKADLILSTHSLGGEEVELSALKISPHEGWLLKIPSRTI